MNPIVAYTQSAVVIQNLRTAELLLQSTLEQAANVDFVRAAELGKAIEQCAEVRGWFMVWQNTVAETLP